MPKKLVCKSCGAPIAKKTEICEYCGAPNPDYQEQIIKQTTVQVHSSPIQDTITDSYAENASAFMRGGILFKIWIIIVSAFAIGCIIIHADWSLHQYIFNEMLGETIAVWLALILLLLGPTATVIGMKALLPEPNASSLNRIQLWIFNLLVFIVIMALHRD